MSPIIVLKGRLERQAMNNPDSLFKGGNTSSLFQPSHRKVSIGSDFDMIQQKKTPIRPSEDAAAMMLLSMSNIVSQEIKSNATCLYEDHMDDEDSSRDASIAMEVSHGSNENGLTPRMSNRSPASSDDEDDDRFTWNRVRTVSIDSPLSIGRTTMTATPTSKMLLGDPAIVSPMNSPTLMTNKVRKTSLRLSHKAKRDHLKIPKISQPSSTTTPAPANNAIKKRTLQTNVAPRGGATIKKILRKKFSWKNYPGTPPFPDDAIAHPAFWNLNPLLTSITVLSPKHKELEAFLIANREEYPRHSALNYTVQQKQYNNRLTERLLELAAEHGYVFDEAEFSFVTVRDRIRCYFKSYVQSAKKRGIIIGYAARKAGLLTEEDLEKSAEQEGMIVTPTEQV